MMTFEQFELKAYRIYCYESESQSEAVLQECWDNSDARQEMLKDWEGYSLGPEL